jgi:uncharacterized protein YkwD
MYNKISVKITMILIMTAALAVPASVLQLSHAQGDLQSTILTTHNNERKAVGVPPLTWSDTIAASAQNWADYLQPLGSQVHSKGTGYGENLAAGGGPTSTKATVAALQQTWVDEKSRYVPGTPGNSHYTQMVDKQSTEVGCGFASGPGGEFAQYGGTNVLVCQYNPPGNFNSQPPY